MCPWLWNDTRASGITTSANHSQPAGSLKDFDTVTKFTVIRCQDAGGHQGAEGHSPAQDACNFMRLIYLSQTGILFYSQSQDLVLYGIR